LVTTSSDNGSSPTSQVQSGPCCVPPLASTPNALVISEGFSSLQDFFALPVAPAADAVLAGTRSAAAASTARAAVRRWPDMGSSRSQRYDGTA
jgi:hypothetical protein